MKIKLLFLPALLSIFLVACGDGDTDSSTSFASASIVTSIFAVGDSIGNGFGGTTPWPRLVQNGTGIIVTNNSQNGRQASGSAGLVRAGIAQFNPSHVIIMLGTNDANNGSVNSAINSMRQIVEETQAAGVQIIVGTVPPNPGDASANSRAAQISAAYRTLGVPIAEVEGAFGNGGGLFQSDQLHPNNEGQQLIANAFINAL